MSAAPSTEAHLAAMTARLPDGLTVPVVAIRANRTRIIGMPTAGDLGATLDAIDKHRDTDNLYLNVGALDLDRARWLQQRSKRGSAADMVALVALHADLDVAGPNHRSEKRYPTSEAAALQILDDVAPPTMLLHTGGGLGAWWVLSEPAPITDDNRDEMGRFVDDWVRTLARHAANAGWEIDANAELTKIMRLAGTLNHKSQPPGRVELRDAGGWPQGGLLEHGWAWRPSAVYDLGQLVATLDPLPRAVSAEKSATPTRTRPAGGDALNILDAVDVAPWSDIWPADWILTGTGHVQGEPVERWLRPGSHADKSVTCWVDGGCRVFSDAIPGLPAGNYSKAYVLAWRLGIDRAELARRIIREARGVTL